MTLSPSSLLCLLVTFQAAPPPPLDSDPSSVSSASCLSIPGGAGAAGPVFCPRQSPRTPTIIISLWIHQHDEMLTHFPHNHTHLTPFTAHGPATLVAAWGGRGGGGQPGLAEKCGVPHRGFGK